MSRALESALQAVARMRGDSDVSTAELLQVLAEALKTMSGGNAGTARKDQNERPH